MTGDELKQIRHRLGLSTTQMGRAFGYTGSDTTSSVTIRKYESGGRPIPPWLARIAIMFDRYEVPDDFLDTKGIRMKELRAEIRAATSVEELVPLLNKFEALRKDMIEDANELDDASLTDDLELDDLPDLDAHPAVDDIDWSDWADHVEPWLADKNNILFRELGRWYYMSVEDCTHDDHDV